MPSDPREPLRVYLTWHEADHPHGERVCQYLQRPMGTEGFTVWHPGKPLPGDHYQDALQRERAGADLRVMLLSIDLMNSEEFTALCALPPGLAIYVKPCHREDPALAGWRPVEALPVNDDRLYAAAQAICREVAALRKKRLAAQHEPLPLDDRIRERVRRLEAEVLKLLQAEPLLCNALAAHLKLPPGADPLGVTRALVQERPARDVANAVNWADAELQQVGAERTLRQAARRLLFQLLPLATDWRHLIAQGWGQDHAARSITLPYASATLAEVVIAGIDERLCRFNPQPTDGTPVGVAAIRLPAAARAPVFDVKDQLLVEAVVRHLSAELRIEPTDDDDERRLRLLGRLSYHAEDARPEDYLPYYLLLDRGALGSGEIAESRWTVARSRLGVALPSLRLVRLTSNKDPDEYRLGEILRAVVRHSP